MTKIEMTVEPEKPSAERGPVLDMARKILMVGIGAMALSQEEAARIVTKLVERGELAEKEGKKLIQDLMDKRRAQAKKAEQELERRVGEVLGRMNVPTTADMEALSAKISALSKKLDELKKG